jgi:sugar lactone lactonase YvrE
MSLPGVTLGLILVTLSAAAAQETRNRTPADFEAAIASFTAALEAEKAGDRAGYRQGIERAVDRLADPTRLVYRLAGARLATGDRAGALDALRRQIDAGFVRDPRADDQFAALTADAGFLVEMARMEALAEPVVTSRELFQLAERQALFEGIAHDPLTGHLFFSSVHRRKVVRRKANGELSDFVASGAHDLAAALGLALDAERRTLWIVSAGLPQASGLAEELRDRSALLAVDLDSGELRRRIEAPDEKHWWNDLVLGSDGSIYVSDPGAAAISRIDANGALGTVVENAGLRSPGGLALSADERSLYVADWSNGMARVDLSDATVTWLAPPAGSTVLGIDGLRRVGSDLIAIQNGITPHRITRFRLAPDGRSLAQAELLERAVPGWDEPTLGTVVDGALVYVGNSQWPSFGGDGLTPDAANLSPTVIRRLPLGGR